ncbi:MAG: insulinase family protein, partial [Bacteroidales bacterium]|nr:insulinase family protein [Bacteroidales bacterium]
RLPVVERVKFDKKLKNKCAQANTILGNYCYSYQSPKRVPMALLSNILAGPGMNSRLNMQLREHHGLSYNIESNYTTYQDIGLFSIFFSSDHSKTDFAVEMIFRELDNLRKKKMGTLQLSHAKKQLIGQVAIDNDSNSNILFPMAKSFMNYGKVETFKEVVSLIDGISADDLLEVANEIFVFDDFSFIKYE